MDNAKQDRKEWFRDDLIEWVKKRRDVAFDELSDVQRSKEMTRFYVKEVVAKLTPGLIPEDFDDIDDYVVDGANDLGVDFIYRSDGSVLIVQSKFRGRQKSEEEESVSHFADVLQRLYAAPTSKKSANQKLREALSDVDWDTDHFDLRFCTLGKVSAQIQEQVKRGPTPVGGMADFSDRVDLSISGETDLNLALREAYSADKEPDTRVALRFITNSEGQPWMKLESEDGRELYIGQISGAEISEIYRPNKYKLFAMNIRDYVGDTATNKGIRQTAVKNRMIFCSSITESQPYRRG